MCTRACRDSEGEKWIRLTVWDPHARSFLRDECCNVSARARTRTRARARERDLDLHDSTWIPTYVFSPWCCNELWCVVREREGDLDINDCIGIPTIHHNSEPRYVIRSISRISHLPYCNTYHVRNNMRWDPNTTLSEAYPELVTCNNNKKIITLINFCLCIYVYINIYIYLYTYIWIYIHWFMYM